MSPDDPLFLAVFFGIFHTFGGLAFGKGARDLTRNPGKGRQLLAWGALMGLTSILFDWFFLIRVGQILYGSIGPALFISAAILGAIFLTQKLTTIHEKSIGTIMMGTAALLIGLMLAPFLIKQALNVNLGPEDYIFGSCLLVLPILVGFGFVWNGVTAIMKNRNFDEHIMEREAEIEEKITRKKKPR